MLGYVMLLKVSLSIFNEKFKSTMLRSGSIRVNSAISPRTPPSGTNRRHRFSIDTLQRNILLRICRFFDRTNSIQKGIHFKIHNEQLAELMPTDWIIKLKSLNKVVRIQFRGAFPI